MYAAAAGFVASDADAVFARHQSLYLRVGVGVFAANLIVGKIKNAGQAVYARARTWLRDDMLDGQRVPLPPAASPDRSIAALLLRMARAANSDQAPPGLVVDSPAMYGGSPAVLGVALEPPAGACASTEGGGRAGRVRTGRLC